METVKVCPRCGKPLAENQVDGLCAECLMKAGLGSVDETASAAVPPSTPKPSGFVPPQPAQLSPHFPNLEIVELLGKGGMGAVYKARQKSLDRLVALKILPPEVGGDPAFEERFTREARALARLSHPNIVTVHEFGQAGGYFYFVMEYVDGMNLRQVLQTRQLDPRQAMAVVPRICEALQYAHDEGIVHRDIKPENVLVDKKGRVKIADFGLAKLVGVGGASLPLTRSAEIMGTPQYMAPEQFEKPLSVDHRADIYSLGVVFYEMLTGELPLGRFAPPSKKVEVDVRLDDVVLRALEKEPERRYQQASQMGTQVETISTTAPPAFSAAPAAPLAASAKPDPAEQQAKGPGIALMVIGGLNLLALTGIAAFGLLFVLPMYFGRPSARSATILTFLIGFVSIYSGLVSGALTVAAGVAMQKLQHYKLVVLGSILAMICSPSNILGIAAGIWALVVLTKKEVKEGFAKGSATTATEPSVAAAPVGMGKKKSHAWAILLVLAVLLLGLLAVPVGLWYLAPVKRHVASQPWPVPVVSNRAQVEKGLKEFASGAVAPRGYEFKDLRIEWDELLVSGKIVFDELSKREKTASGQFEPKPATGGFSVRTKGSGHWELTGTGQLEGQKANVTIINR